ncbi:hypothetical protein FVW20_04655, partial [Desulfovibrio oxamicus]
MPSAQRQRITGRNPRRLIIGAQRQRITGRTPPAAHSKEPFMSVHPAPERSAPRQQARRPVGTLDVRAA